MTVKSAAFTVLAIGLLVMALAGLTGWALSGGRYPIPVLGPLNLVIFLACAH